LLLEFTGFLIILYIADLSLTKNIFSTNVQVIGEICGRESYIRNPAKEMFEIEELQRSILYWWTPARISLLN